MKRPKVYFHQKIFVLPTLQKHKQETIQLEKRPLSSGKSDRRRDANANAALERLRQFTGSDPGSRQQGR